MSARAIRKLQKQREEETALAAAQESQSESEHETYSSKPKVANAFDLLNAQDDDEDDDEDEVTGPTKPNADDEEEPDAVSDEEIATPSKTIKSKRKNKKKKRKSKAATNVDASTQDDSTVDEIDQALKALGSSGDAAQIQEKMRRDNEFKKFFELLAVDSKHLNSMNEMRKLFGNINMNDIDEEGGNARRRGARGAQRNLDLGAALEAQHSPVSRGQGLTGLQLKRNVFILGKETWPRLPSGGLGMELLEHLSDSTVEYRFTFSKPYIAVEREYRQCVETMDPQRMIRLLQFNPYHISTILQVAEIASHQGDHAIAGDLYERALFNFGRSVHSTFSHSLSAGQARLNFSYLPHRQFWLTAFKYIETLGLRGTWRTAFEWAKLLLALDPEGDPYLIRFFIDQLALRGGQEQALLNLAEFPIETLDWGQARPNVQISSALALFRLKRGKEARERLSSTMQRWPWMFGKLFSELGIDKLPKCIWGIKSRTPREEFETEMYVHRAKDLWNTPESTSFLVEVGESTTADASKIDPLLHSNQEVSLDEARHLLVSNIPRLLSYVPKKYLNAGTSSVDPLPPVEDMIHEDGLSVHGGDDDEEDEEELAVRQSAAARPGLLENLLLRLGMGGAWPNREAGVPAQAVNAAPRGQDPLGAGRVALNTGNDDEEGDSEDELVEQLLASSEGQEILRQLSEVQGRGGNGPAPTAAATNAAPRQATVEDAPDDEDEHEPQAQGATGPEPYDDERNQRWLAGQGMFRLREFVQAHGTDESKWDSSVDRAPLIEYVDRVKQVKTKASRGFIVDYALQQGAGSQARDLVLKMLER